MAAGPGSPEAFAPSQVRMSCEWAFHGRKSGSFCAAGCAGRCCACAQVRWGLAYNFRRVWDGTAQILTGCSFSHTADNVPHLCPRSPTRKKVPCCAREPVFYSPSYSPQVPPGIVAQISECKRLFADDPTMPPLQPHLLAAKTTLGFILAYAIPIYSRGVPPFRRHGCHHRLVSTVVIPQAFGFSACRCRSG